jgi:hypothetical protein
MCQHCLCNQQFQLHQCSLPWCTGVVPGVVDGEVALITTIMSAE